MKYPHLTTVKGLTWAACLVALLAWLNPSAAQDTDPANTDLGQPLARGPVHEAYANPADPRPEALPLVPKEPPPLIEETPPDQKPSGDNVIWIPGYWSWDQDRTDYIWISGFWRIPPPGRQWAPGHWQQVGDEWQWSSGMWAATDQTEVQYLPPPPTPVEAAPSIPAPDAESFYVPGTWVYRETRYRWQPGFWLGYRPGWMWMPAHYVWTPVGYVFVDGYWDYPLADRGLLFSPMYFDRRDWRDRFVYRPRYVVNTDFLFGSLFARSGFGSYYFGDYFEPAYLRGGFVPWIDLRVNRYSYDPLYSYYRFANGRDRNWDRDLHTLFRGRIDGNIDRPPQTLVQQTKIINNITNNNTNITNNTTNVTNIRNVTALSTLNQVTTNNKDIKLVKVTKEEVAQQQKHAQLFQQAAVQRRQVESKLITQNAGATKTDKPVAAKIEVPKIATLNNAAPTRTPPKLPTPPAHEDRPIPKQDVTKPKTGGTTPAAPGARPLPPVKEGTQPPPPRNETQPPPAPKKETQPPPAPKKETAPPPAPKKETAPPPPPPKKDTPPPPKKDGLITASPAKNEPPPVKHETPPPPPPVKHETPPPPPVKQPSPPPPPPPVKQPSPPPPAPAPAKQPPPPPAKHEAPPPPKQETPPKKPPTASANTKAPEKGRHT